MIPFAESLPSGFAEAIAANYRIERKIGQGGMAMVFLATDLRHSRPVAIKVLHPMIANAIGRRRFLREIDTVARLSHPNILPLHDSGDASGALYYVMPFVEGQSLRDLLLAERQLSEAVALRITTEIAAALQYAHERGLVHRDIKPENVLLQSGHAIVCDFGIALAESTKPSEHLTTEPSNLGTPAYASPEQITGTHQLDGRSDVYSLAVVLHEMLTGVRPPRIDKTSGNGKRATASSLRKAVDGVQLPAWLDQVLERALELDPNRRYQSVEEFELGLRGATVTRSPLLMRTTALATVCGLVGAWWFSLNPTPPVTGVQAQRIVVMPFTNPNSTPNPDLRILGVLAADWITSGLQRTNVVDVVPSTIALAVDRDLNAPGDSLKSMPNYPQQVSSATNAGIVVSGTIYEDGSDLLFNVQITDARESKLLGSIGPLKFKGSDRNSAIASVNSQVMAILAQKFNKDIGLAIANSGRQPSYEAYVEFATGIDFYSQNKSVDATKHFLAAYAIDSSFVPALLMASIARSNTQDYLGADSLLRRVAPYRDQLSNYDQLWFDYRRNLVAGHRSEALAQVRLLATMAPGTKATYNLAVEAMQNGFLVEARDALLSLSPESGPMHNWAPYWDILTRTYHLLGDARHELQSARRAMALYPTRRYIANVLARALAEAGREPELLQLLDSIRVMPPDPTGLTQNGIAMEAAIELRAHNHRGSAERVLHQLLRRLDSLPPDSIGITSNRLLRARAKYELQQWRVAQLIADSLILGTASSNFEMLGLAGAAAARAGDTVSARQRLAQLNAVPKAFTAGAASFARARIFSVLGNTTEAMTALQQAVAEGKAYGFWPHADFDFAGLVGGPAFREVVKPKQ